MPLHTAGLLISRLLPVVLVMKLAVTAFFQLSGITSNLCATTAALLPGLL